CTDTQNCAVVPARGNFWSQSGSSCLEPTCKYPYPTSEQGVDTGNALCSAPPVGGCNSCPARPAPPAPPAASSPDRPALVAIQPNPFNPITTVEFELKRPTWTTLSIYNVAGQLVRVESLGGQPAGKHDWVWNGADQHGNPVSSGVYFIVLRAGTVTDRKKA